MTAPDLLARLDALGTPIAAATLRGAVILVVALFVTQLLRRRSAATRHAIWSGAIAAQLLVLALGIWGPHWRVATPRALADIVAPVVAIPDADVGAPVDRSYPSLVVASAPNVPAAQAATQPTRLEITPVVPAPAPATTPILTGRNLLLLLWLGGALFVAFRLAAGTVMVAMLARRGARVDDGHWLSLTQKLASSLGIERPLILMRGTLVSVPITWGIVYPIVLLPSDADGWTEERRRFVLVHEMAHVKRLDALTQLVGQVALAIFWFNPLVWIANRRMQLEREHACDDYVLRHGTAPSQYAEELLEMVRSLGRPGQRNAQPAFAALAMARRNEFEGRMLSILDPVLDRHPLSRGRTMIGALASLLLVIPLAALQPYRAAEAGFVAGATAPRPRDELPESFKISIHDVSPQQRADTSSRSSASSSASSASSSSRANGRDTTGLWGSSLWDSSMITRALAPATKALAAKQATLATAVSTVSTAINGKQPTCSAISLGGRSIGTSTHIHSDGDNGSLVLNYLSYDENRCAQANLVGKITFAADESDVTGMPGDAHAVFRERTTSDDRELTLYRTDGGIARVYRHNGADAPYDDDARRWFARFLPRVLQEAAYNVGPRVARWREQGGVDRALEGIASIRSSGAKRTHYEALLDQGHLSGDEADRLVKQASRDLPSSGDLTAVLTKAAPMLRNQGSSARMLGGAFSAVPSSGDRTAVLQAYGVTDNRDVLLAVMRVAKTIPSSGDLANLLATLAPKYLSGKDAALRDAWFDAAKYLSSSGDLHNVLTVATGYANRSDDHVRRILETAPYVASSGDRSEVLIGVADAGGLRTAALRDMYMDLAMHIPSSGDMRRVLEAATRH